MVRRIALLSLLLAAAAGAVERDPAGYERVLVPVDFSGPRPGAFGSLWVSDFIGRNEGTIAAQVLYSECAFFCTCVGITCSDASIRPGAPFRLFPHPDDNRANPGHFLYLGRSTAHQVAMQLRVRDASRSATSFGTEVPLIREGEMRITPIYLLDIPLDERFRQHLRVYGIGNLSDIYDVRVRVFSGHSDTLLADFPMRLTVGQVSGLPEKDEFPTHPAYGEISSLRSLVGSSIERVRVEVIPQTPGVRFWAFVAVTNNETQHVTLVTPQ